MIGIFGGVLVLKARGPDRLELGLSLGFRAVFLAILILVAFALFIGVRYGEDPRLFQRANTLPLLMEAISLCALFYRERWIFDRRRNLFESQHGLMFLYRRQSLPLSDLERIQLAVFYRGSVSGREPEPRRFFQRKMLRLLALDRAGDAHVLEVGRSAHAERLERAGERIAALCGVPFSRAA